MGAASFEELYRSQYRPLVALGSALTGSMAEAEELVQESFLSAHEAWSTVGSYDRPDLWLRRVLVNRCTSRWRKRRGEAKANATHDGEVRSTSGSSVAALPDGQLVAAIRRLPARQAQVLVLHYVDDLSVEVVSMTLRISPATTKTHLHRALRTLRRELDDRSDHDG